MRGARHEDRHFGPHDDGLDSVDDVSRETCVKDITGLAAGEITVAGKVGFETDVRGVAINVSFDSFIDGLSGVDSCPGVSVWLQFRGPRRGATPFHGCA